MTRASYPQRPRHAALLLAAFLLSAQAAPFADAAPASPSTAAAPPTPPSGAVLLSADVARPQWRISTYLTGMHFVYGFERDSLYRDERIAAWMRRARVGMIRWPGGTAVQSYHWDALNGISFLSDTWDPANRTPPAPPEDYMDLDEYIAFCRRVGAEPLVGVNIGSGKKFNRVQDSLDEARRLIRHCVDRGHRVRHWYIGNEAFKGWTPAAYARDIDRYAEVLKSVDPDIVIVADWKFGPESKHRFEQAVLIARTSRHIDVMEIHEKWGEEWGLNEELGEPTLAAWQSESGLFRGKLDECSRRFVAEMKAAGRDVRLAFNEWGASMAGTGDPFLVALVKADYLITLFRNPVYSACDWNLNMGAGKSRILVTRDNGRVLAGFNPAAQVFELCAPALGHELLALSSSDRLVYGFAAADPAGGAVRVYVLNKYAADVETDLAVAGAPAITEVATFAAPGAVKVAETRQARDGRSIRLRLAPLSFTRVTLAATRDR